MHAIVAIGDGECFKYDNVDGCYDMDDDQRTDNDECINGNECIMDGNERTDRRDARQCVSTTRNATSPTRNATFHSNKSNHPDVPNQSFQSNKSNRPFQRQPKSISSFVAGYKSAVVNQIDDFIDMCNLPMKKFNKQNPLWQANYHDHIIRNDASYLRIKNYIINNPMNWNDDTINTNNMFGP